MIRQAKLTNDRIKALKVEIAETEKKMDNPKGKLSDYFLLNLKLRILKHDLEGIYIARLNQLT